MHRAYRLEEGESPAAGIRRIAVCRAELAAERDAEVKRLTLERLGKRFPSAPGLGERLYAEKPKAFRKRMRRGWKAWRSG
jgi:hypothetical protein